MPPIGVTQPKVCWGVLYLLDSCGVPGRQLPCQLLYLNRLDFGLAQNAEVDLSWSLLGMALMRLFTALVNSFGDTTKLMSTGF